jgi:hypothetical protein
MDSSRQLKEDNLLLRKDLQAYQEREQHLLSRMDVLEKRLFEIQDKARSRSRRGSGSASESVFKHSSDLNETRFAISYKANSIQFKNF